MLFSLCCSMKARLMMAKLESRSFLLFGPDVFAYYSSVD